MENNTIIETQNLTKIYKAGRIDVHALNGVDIQVGRGEFVSIMGPSGCGKSTLLYLLGGLTKPTAGTIKIDGLLTSRFSRRRLTKLRQKRIGFIFQTLNLLPTLNALDNLDLALKITKPGKNGFKSRELLDMVGLDGKRKRRPSELSYGEQQRVAIARAMINKPSILLADEPTGNLDSQNAEMIMGLLKSLNKELNQTIVLITHDQNVANHSSRILRMKDGKIIS